MKNYEQVKIEITKLDSSDIIATSGVTMDAAGPEIWNNGSSPEEN